jgi:hypothetical protein
VATPYLHTYACMGILILIIWEITWQKILSSGCPNKN